jgi:putative two-component system response regulator
MSPATILIVDDNPQNLTVLGELLCNDHKVRTSSSGERAVQLALQLPHPDLILLDVMMPDMTGYEVMAQLRLNEQTKHIPVIFVTALNSEEDEQRGLDLGAVDFVTKPLRPAIIAARVQTHLAIKRMRESLQHRNRSLESEVRRRMRDFLLAQEVTMRALARLAETRDNETGNHILRTQAFVRLLAQRLRSHPRFAAALDDRAVSLMAKSAPLHDIGKVGIPDSVLLKPGPLDAQEWALMQTHAALGADALARAETDLSQPIEFLSYAKQIARHHHERWNGTGYPDRLKGDDIPLAARVMAVADVFDALISPRVYKPAIDFDRARGIMAAQRGEHFDPDMLDTFIEHYAEFCAIAQQHRDQ